MKLPTISTVRSWNSNADKNNELHFKWSLIRLWKRLYDVTSWNTRGLKLMISAIPPRPLYRNLKGLLPLIFELLICIKISMLLNFLKFFYFLNLEAACWFVDVPPKCGIYNAAVIKRHFYNAWKRVLLSSYSKLNMIKHPANYLGTRTQVLHKIFEVTE